MKTISIRFRCGHFESLTPAQIKRQQVEVSPAFVINGQAKAESGQYCLACSGVRHYGGKSHYAQPRNSKLNPLTSSSTTQRMNRPHQSPCSVERTHRIVIERKLLTALEDADTVAALFSKQDLEDIIAALLGYVLSHTKGNTVSWEAHLKRRKELADAMSQLLREAFPPAVTRP